MWVTWEFGVLWASGGLTFDVSWGSGVRNVMFLGVRASNSCGVLEFSCLNFVGFGGSRREGPWASRVCRMLIWGVWWFAYRDFVGFEGLRRDVSWGSGVRSVRISWVRGFVVRSFAGIEAHSGGLLRA